VYYILRRTARELLCAAAFWIVDVGDWVKQQGLSIKRILGDEYRSSKRRKS